MSRGWMTSFIITSATSEVVDEAEASSNSDPNYVYVAPIDDHVSSSLIMLRSDHVVDH